MSKSIRIQPLQTSNFCDARMAASFLINSQNASFKFKISIEKLLSCIFLFTFKTYLHSNSSEHKDIFSWTLSVLSEQNAENASVAEYTD